jgi:polyhydroxybutyrate depolymerase
MRKFLAIVGALSLALLLPGCGGGGGGDGTNASDPSAPPSATATPKVLVVGGVVRTYSLYVPPNFQPSVSGLVIALHGAGESALTFEALTQLTAKAQQVGFAVVYPDGIGKDWNYLFSSLTSNDDIGFIRALIGALQTNIHPDAKRLYVTGFSDGGRMAYYVAMTMSELIAAVGVVEGTLYSGKRPDQLVPNPTVPVPVVALQGDQDVLLCGRPPPEPSQDGVFDYWTASTADNCSAVDTTSTFCSGPMTIYERHGTNCLSNAEVRIYILINGIHTWYQTPMNIPGTSPYNPALDATTGVTTNDILWNFFSAHPKQ